MALQVPTGPHGGYAGHCLTHPSAQEVGGMTLKGDRGPRLSPGNESQLKCLKHGLSTGLHPNSSSVRSSRQKVNKILGFIKKSIENKTEDNISLL